jgi:sugar-phosphatase
LACARLGAAGIPLPRVLITADDVTRGKPDPEGYLTAASELGVFPSEALVLEDSASGVEAGREADVAAVVGVGAPALQTDADVVVTDLTSLSWAGSGLAVLETGALRPVSRPSGAR